MVIVMTVWISNDAVLSIKFKSMAIEVILRIK